MTKQLKEAPFEAKQEKICPSCGMSQKDWGEKAGHAKDGHTHCCRGCADGTGCTC